MATVIHFVSFEILVPCHYNYDQLSINILYNIFLNIFHV